MKYLIPVLFSLLCIFSCGKTSDQLNMEAEALEAKGEYSKSIILLKKAIEKDPENKYAYMNLGVDQSTIEDYQGAIDTYSTIIKIDPKNGLAYLNRGKNKARLQDFKGAIIDYNAAINTQGGEFIQIRFNNDHFDLGAEFEVDMEEVLSERAIAYYQIDSMTLAFNDLNFCISKQHEISSSYYWRGYVYLACNQMLEACQDFESALSHGDTAVNYEIKKFCQ
jgi:tetratricopeptide (TPR) repeat protein